MSKRTCQVQNCERPYRCSGFCSLHYDRMRRHGTTDVNLPPVRICQVPDCGLPHNCQGYCKAHYKRLLIHGDVQAWKPLRKLPNSDEREDIVGRILAKCEWLESGCVEWHGDRLPNGYGVISWNGRAWVVHRVMYTVRVGPIPTDDDWTVDHLCFNRACVNVGHLEVVTRTENSLRGEGLLIARANKAKHAAARTHCHRGHDLAEVGQYAIEGGRRQICKQCSKDDWAKQSARINARKRAEYAASRG